MQFPFLLAVLAALVIAENCPTMPAEGVLWRSELTVLAIALVVVAAQAISSVTAVRIRQRPEESEKILSISGRWRRMHTVLWIGMVTVVSVGIGWPQIVRFNWGLDRTFLLDELLILLPVLIPLVLSWVAFYQIERAAYAARIVSGIPAARPAPTLRHFLSLHVRHYLGVMLLPILLLIAAQDAVVLWMPDALRSGWSTVVYAVPVVVLVLFFPSLLQRLWKTRPLAAGELRERLTALSSRAGLPVREILVWDTRGVVVNAAVSGWIPRHRYVFLTDGLIDRLTSEQIEGVFGHELGHIRRRHLLLRGLVMVAPLSLLLGLEIVWPESATLSRAISPQLLTTAQLPLALGTLVLLASYAYFVFGGYCRLLEREADLYACRMLETETPEEAYRLFSSALERLAIESGVPRDKSTWQHPSIARRTAFLMQASHDPTQARRLERRVGWLNWLLASCVIGAAVAAVFV